jgi:hypothetical protein
MKPVKKIEFEADLIKEYSYTSEVTPLGKKKCSMELYTETGSIDDSDCGDIEWIIDVGTPGETAIQLGVWWRGKTLIEFDGNFSLPDEAIRLLRECGIIVSEDFEDK